MTRISLTEPLRTAVLFKVVACSDTPNIYGCKVLTAPCDPNDLGTYNCIQENELWHNQSVFAVAHYSNNPLMNFLYKTQRVGICDNGEFCLLQDNIIEGILYINNATTLLNQTYKIFNDTDHINDEFLLTAINCVHLIK